MPGSTPAARKTIQGSAPAQTRRTIQGSPPLTGTYVGATVPQLHGQGSNKTADFLAAIPAEHPGQQAFYREALTMPDPLGSGQHITYGQLQDLLNGPKRAAALDAYARANNMPTVTSAAMQEALFNQARQALAQRGAAGPDEYAFPPSAAEALQAPIRARAIRAGNFTTPEAAGQATSGTVQAERFANLSNQAGAYAAPGVPLLGISERHEPPATMPRVRLIRGTTGQSVAGR